MICVNCGTHNPDEATFCKNCGKRIDGMFMCPSCGKLTPADGEFCIYCGADKNAVRAPVAASKTLGEAGEAVMAEAAAVAITADVAAEHAGGEFVLGKYRGLLKKVSFLFSALAALMGIIFVFLIDFSISASTGGISASVSSGYDIFYFFGDAYDDINAIASSISTYAENALTAGTVFGTVCCAVGMAVTVICFLVAAVRIFKIIGGKTEKSHIAPCAAAFISFVFTAALFMMCIATSLTASGTKSECTLGVAAIVGIVLGAVFLAISVVTDILANVKVGVLRRCAFNWVFGVLILVFGFVAVGIMAKGIFSYEAGSSLSGTYGLYMLFGYIIYGIAPTSQNTSSEKIAFNEMYSTELGLAIVLVIAAVGFFILFTRAFSEILSGRGGVISPRAIKCAMFAGLFALICGAMMIACTQVYLDYIEEGYKASLAIPVTVMVFGLLLMVVSIMYNKREKISAFSPYISE